MDMTDAGGDIREREVTERGAGCIRSKADGECCGMEWRVRLGEITRRHGGVDGRICTEV